MEGNKYERTGTTKCGAAAIVVVTALMRKEAAYVGIVKVLGWTTSAWSRTITENRRMFTLRMSLERKWALRRQRGVFVCRHGKISGIRV